MLVQKFRFVAQLELEPTRDKRRPGGGQYRQNRADAGAPRQMAVKFRQMSVWRSPGPPSNPSIRQIKAERRALCQIRQIRGALRAPLSNPRNDLEACDGHELPIC